MRALLRVRAETTRGDARPAFTLDAHRSANRAPLARLLADLARVALGPSLDLEHRRIRDDAEERADGTQEAAVEIAHEHRRDEQHREARPHRRRPEQAEH